jgi:hypothetical protein
MSKWRSETIKLGDNHGWVTRPGNNMFVADRGAVMFEYPTHWKMSPAKDGSIQFRDKPHPDDDAILAVSVNYMHPDLDWRLAPLGQMVSDVASRDKRNPFFVGEPIEIHRRHLDAAWIEIHFIDSKEKREARGRMCVGFQANIQTLITFDFWLSDMTRMNPVWTDVLETLVIGHYIADPQNPKI